MFPGLTHTQIFIWAKLMALNLNRCIKTENIYQRFEILKKSLRVVLYLGSQCMWQPWQPFYDKNMRCI